MFEQLKNHPKMALVIDKFPNASSSSSKRTAQWLYEKMVEVIEIHQFEENTQSVDKNLSLTDSMVDAAPVKPNKPGKGDKTSKGDKDPQTSLRSLRSLTSLTKEPRMLMPRLLRVKGKRMARQKEKGRMIRTNHHLRG